jgi:hypothetical protein
MSSNTTTEGGIGFDKARSKEMGLVKMKPSALVLAPHPSKC